MKCAHPTGRLRLWPKLRGTTGLILAAACLLPLAPQAIGGELFMTAIEKKEGENRAKKKFDYYVPAKTKIAYAWSDRGFAIHVPFKAETEFYSRRYHDGRKEEGYRSKPYVVEVWVTGLSFLHPKQGKRYADLARVNIGAYWGGGSWNDTEGRGKRYHLGTVPNREERSGRKPARLRTYGFVKKTGTLTVWAALVPYRDTSGFGRPAWDHWGESVTGTFHVIVRRKKTEKEPEKTILKEEFPFKIRQNAWVVRKAHVKKEGAWGKVVDNRNNREWTLADRGVQLQGSTLTTKHRRTGSPMNRSVTGAAADYEIRYTFSQRLFDHKGSEMTVRAAQTGGFISRWGHMILNRVEWTFLPWPAPDGDKIPERMRTTADGVISVKGGFSASDRDLVVDPKTKLRYRERKVELPFKVEEWKHARELRTYTIRRPPQRGGYDQNWIDLRRVGKHRLIEIREEYRSLGGEQKQPKRTIEVEVARLSEVEDNRRGNITDPRDTGPAREPRDDGYYTWITKFSEKRLQLVRDLQAAHASLSALHTQWRDKRKFALKLMRLFCQGQLSDDVDDEEMWLVVRRHLEGTGAPLVGKMSNKQLKKLRNRRRVLGAELAAIRDEQRLLIIETTVALETLARSARDQAKRSGRRRPYVAASGRFWTDKAAMERVKLYESAGLYKETRKAIDELKLDAKHLDTYSPQMKYFAHLMEGKARIAEAEETDQRIKNRLAQGQKVGGPLAMSAQRLRMLALYALRRAHKMNPRDSYTKTNVQKLELTFLYLIQAKVEREKQVTWEAFASYLAARGFDMDKPKSIPWAVWECFKNTFGAGPIGPVYWVHDKAGARADRAIIAQTAAARDLIALRTIRRLRATGVTLKEIRKLTGEALREVLLGCDGNKLELKVAKTFALDIQKAFASLPELSALADGTEDEFRKKLVTPHFSMEFESTWPEWSADWFNSFNVGTFFLGGSIWKVNGKWATTIIKPKGLLGMNVRPGAGITRFRDLAVSGFRSSRFGAALKKPGFVKWLADRISVGNEFVDKLYVIRYFAKGGRVFGAVVLYGGIHVAADEYNVPALAVFVDALAAFGVGEMLGTVLDDIALPAAKAAKKVATYKGILKARKDQLSRRLTDLDEVTRILRESEGAAARPPGSPRKNLTDEQKRVLEEIRQKYNIDPNDPIPGLNPSMEIDMLLADTCNGIENGHVKSAGRSAKAAKSAMKSEVVNVDEALIQADHVLDALEDEMARAAKRAVRRPYTKELTARENPVPEPWMPAAGYPDEPCGALWQEADQWFARGDLDAALRKFQQARHLAVKSGPKGYVKMLDRRLGMVVTVRNAAKYLLDTANVLTPLKAEKFIGADELAAVQRRINAGELKVVLQKRQGTNALYEIHAEGKPVYVFKKLVQGDADAKATELANEELGALLFNAPGLGTRAPAARKTHLQLKYVKLDGGQGGAAKGLGLLMRHVPGREMLDQRESMLYALKGDYAKLRVLSLLLGDADRHLRNYLLAGDHLLWPLDFGNSHLFKKGTRIFRMGLKREVFKSERALMEYCANFAGEVQKKVTKGGGNLKNRDLYNWMKQVEDVLDYDVDMKPTVEALRRFVKKNNGKELREMLDIAFQKMDANGKRLFDADGKPVVDVKRAREAFDVINERVDLLDPVLRKRYPPWGRRKPALRVPRSPTDGTGGGERSEAPARAEQDRRAA